MNSWEGTMKNILLLGLAFASIGSIAEVRGYSENLYLCREIVVSTDINDLDAVAKRTYDDGQGNKIWDIESHVISVTAFANGKSNVDFDGANLLTPAKTDADMLGKAIPGYNA